MTWPLSVWPSSESSRLARPKSVILGAPSAGKQDVGRLEVAMDDPGLVGDVDGPGQGAMQLGRRPARLRGACQAVGEAAPLEQLQGDERQAVGLADVVDLDDVGMAEPGDRLGLDAEAGDK